MNYVVNRSEIVSDLIDGEVILLDLKAGTYYNLEGTAATLWQWLEGGVSTPSIRQALAEAYPDRNPDDLHEDLNAWLQNLVSNRLLLAQENAPDAEVRGPDFFSPYSCPQLCAHADMEELLKLDPVHEAGDPGWPATPTL
jgi:hypothetical protein